MKKIFIYSLPILFLIGSLGHFMYEWTNNNFIIGLFFSTSESIYEHTKLVMVPLIIFYIFGYIKYKINIDKWLTCFIAALLTSIILIPLLYYFYTCAFNIESLLVDILIYFVSLTLGQLLSLHIYTYQKKYINYKIVLVIFITYFILNIMFTINPPDLPIFKY